MLVRRPGILDHRRGLLVTLAKSHERPGIEPERTVVLMDGQQLLERAVIVLPKQAPGEDVSNSLIVVYDIWNVERTQAASRDCRCRSGLSVPAGG